MDILLPPTEAIWKQQKLFIVAKIVDFHTLTSCLGYTNQNVPNLKAFSILMDEVWNLTIFMTCLWIFLFGCKSISFFV